jgi:YggT family protein
MEIFRVLSAFFWYLIAGVILLVAVLMLARVILNQADLNPFSRPVLMLRRWTDPLVNPVRRPLVQFGFSPNLTPLVVILIAISFIGFLLFGLLATYSLLIFMRIVFSWVASPMNPMLHFLIRATEPILGPFRRIIPPLGMFDISPIIVLFLLDLLQKAVAATLI